MSTVTTTAAWRRLTATVLGAGAIAIGGMALLAPAAYAEVNGPTEAQAECAGAGGDYSSESDAGGNTFEKCCYEGLIAGVKHCDVWVNGKWNGDLSFREEPTTPPVTPGAPPKVGGTPERSPDAQNPPKKPFVPTFPGQTSVAK